MGIGWELRFHPALIDLKTRLDDGVLGQLICVDTEQGEYLPLYHPDEDYRESYAARSDLGGGVVYLVRRYTRLTISSGCSAFRRRSPRLAVESGIWRSTSKTAPMRSYSDTRETTAHSPCTST